METRKRPNIPSRMLWEYDYETFNFDKSYRLVCERVFERGNLFEWREMMGYYTLAQIKDSIEWSAQLDEQDKVFCRFFIYSDLVNAA